MPSVVCQLERSVVPLSRPLRPGGLVGLAHDVAGGRVDVPANIHARTGDINDLRFHQADLFAGSGSEGKGRIVNVLRQVDCVPLNCPSDSRCGFPASHGPRACSEREACCRSGDDRKRAIGRL